MEQQPPGKIVENSTNNAPPKAQRSRHLQNIQGITEKIATDRRAQNATPAKETQCNPQRATPVEKTLSKLSEHNPCR